MKLLVACRQPLRHESRPPAGARGLKLLRVFVGKRAPMSRPPAGARGLKLMALVFLIFVFCRAPPRGRAD